ncbi:MAG: hypothetical protein ACJ75J_06805, partial [Cytophagaceae bacterium]
RHNDSHGDNDLYMITFAEEDKTIHHNSSSPQPEKKEPVLMSNNAFDKNHAIIHAASEKQVHQ